MTALAVLIPQQRTYATETSTSSNSNTGTPLPPPGFDAKQAKQPLSSSDERKPVDQAAGKNGASEITATAKQVAASTENAVASGKKMIVESEKRSVEKKEEIKKMTLGQKIKHEIQHYWDGTKLLATEVRISVKLAMKMAAGYELSRRENRQVRYC